MRILFDQFFVKQKKTVPRDPENGELEVLNVNDPGFLAK